MAADNPQITVEEIARRLEGSFPGDLGVEVLEIGHRMARGRMLVDERHLHPGGYVHGGAWVALADTVAAWGTLRQLPPGHDFTTIELKMNVLAAGRPGDELIAEAAPVHTGRSTHVWEVRVSNGRRQVAHFLCTQMVLPPGTSQTGPGEAGS